MSKTIGSVLIDVKADTSKLVFGMQKAEKTILRTTNSMKNAIKGLAAAYLSFEGARAFLNMADSYTLVSGRLKLVTNSTAEFVMVQKELLKIANESRVGLTDTVDTYSRIARSTKELGVSSKDTLAVTSAINKALIVSGANAASANAALLQLGQGFASGTLRGQELNSVMEQTPRLSQAIADGMGVTIGELRKLGEEGKLTSKSVYDAILNQKDAIEKEFEQLPATVAQNMIVLGNTMMDVVGEIDKATGATQSLGNNISKVSTSIAVMSETFKQNKEEVGANVRVIALIGGSMLSATIAIKTYNGVFSLSTAIIQEHMAKTALHTTLVAAETKAQQLGAYATSIRSVAEKANTLGIINNTTATKVQISALNKKALAAEIAAKKQTTLSYSMRASATSAGLLSKAMRAIPFIAIAGAIYMVGDALLTSAHNADILDEAITTSGDSLKKLTLNQLEYQKVVTNSAIWDALKEYNQAYADTINKSWLESEEDHKKELALLDAKKKKYEDLKKIHDEISLQIENKNKNLMGSMGDFRILEREIDAKNNETKKTSIELYLKEHSALINSISSTREYNSLLTQQMNIVGGGIGKISKARALLIDYYESIGNKQEAWEYRADDLFERFLPLGEDRANKLINAKKNEYFKKTKRDTSASLSVWSDYYKKIRNLENAWLTSSKRNTAFNDALSLGLKGADFNSYMGSIKKGFLDGVEDPAKKSAKATAEAFAGTARQLKSSFESFFDYASDGFMDFGKLAKNIIHEIYMDMVKTQIAKPLTSGFMSGLESIFFADGGVMSSDGAIPLKAYSSGGIANSPQLAIYGEGSMNEAYVPLPDGRSIPVTMNNSKSTGDVYINIVNESGTPVNFDVINESINDGDKTISIVMRAIERNPDMRNAIKGIR